MKKGITTSSELFEELVLRMSILVDLTNLVAFYDGITALVVNGREIDIIDQVLCKTFDVVLYEILVLKEGQSDLTEVVLALKEGLKPTLL